MVEFAMKDVVKQGLIDVVKKIIETEGRYFAGDGRIFCSRKGLNMSRNRSERFLAAMMESGLLGRVRYPEAPEDVRRSFDSSNGFVRLSRPDRTARDRTYLYFFVVPDSFFPKLLNALGAEKQSFRLPDLPLLVKKVQAQPEAPKNLKKKKGNPTG
jgi:hypothetical protein